uniref:Uncharacterized protein n=1 Tax=Knipowitschia caucasica TaxID=637954 RepID=A0AAV2LPH2_KNICA
MLCGGQNREEAEVVESCSSMYKLVCVTSVGVCDVSWCVSSVGVCRQLVCVTSVGVCDVSWCVCDVSWCV